MERCRGVRGHAYTYRFGNQEAGEEVEDREKEWGANGGKSGIGSDGHHHHAVVSVVQHTEEEDEQEPEELGGHPLESNHGVRDACVDHYLHKHVRHLHNHLQNKENNLENLDHRYAEDSSVSNENRKYAL